MTHLLMIRPMHFLANHLFAMAVKAIKTGSTIMLICMCCDLMRSWAVHIKQYTSLSVGICSCDILDVEVGDLYVGLSCILLLYMLGFSAYVIMP